MRRQREVRLEERLGGAPEVNRSTVLTDECENDLAIVQVSLRTTVALDLPIGLQIEDGLRIAQPAIPDFVVDILGQISFRCA